MLWRSMSHSASWSASGGVMAVVFLTAMIYPRMQVLLFFVLPIELRWLAAAYSRMPLPAPKSC